MYKQLQTCILIFYFQNLAQSYQVYRFNSMLENDMLPTLKELIQKERYKETDFIENERLARALKYHKSSPMGKSVFVKRIIPHGYHGSDYEYDPKLNTVFKPLFRFHIKKPIVEHEKRVLKELESDQNREGHFRIGKNRFRNERSRFQVGQGRFRNGRNPFQERQDRFQNGRSRFQKWPKQFREGKGRFQNGENGLNDALIVLVNNDRRNPQELLRQIKKYINKNTVRLKKKQRRFKSILGRIKNYKDGIHLRSYQKSGEIHDPLAPANVQQYTNTPQPVNEEKPQYIQPSYPFWNYWTYKKTIVQDQCKGNLIQMGNMCISPIGHRKYLESTKNFKNIFNPWEIIRTIRPEDLADIIKKLKKIKKPPTRRLRKNFYDEK